MKTWLRSHKLKLLIVVACASVLVLPLLTMMVSHFIALQQNTKLREVGVELAKHYPAILADLKLLDATPIFPENQFARDAQPFLSLHISWEGKKINPIKESKVLNEELRQQYPKTDADLLKKLVANKAFLEKFNTAWMDELYKYDHLSFFTRPEVAADLQNIERSNSIARIGILATYPAPNFMELRSWANLYAVKSFVAGHPEGGLKMIHKVSELANSSQTLLGAMIAVAMLKSERFYAEQFHVQNWILISDEKINAYKRVTWAMVALTKAPLYGKLSPEFEPYMLPRNGLCIGVTENIGGLMSFQEFLEPRVPFEIDFRTQFTESRQRQSRYLELCHAQAISDVLSPPPREANPWLVSCNDSIFAEAQAMSAADDSSKGAACWPPYYPNPVRMPFLRRAIGLILMTIAIPNYTKQYEQ